MVKTGLSYREVNKQLIEKIGKYDINEQTILNSTNLINENERKKGGIFYTPEYIVDNTHNLLKKELGQKWKSSYVVWDCACGKGNLTKKYKFKNLYLSTIEETDIEFIKKSNINPEATSFVFDFLNDPIENIPKGLLDSLKKKKKILFLINPPYTKDTTTEIAKEMKDEGLTHYEYTLTYIQFLNRILEIKKQFKIKNLEVSFITPLSFLTKKTFAKFRNKIFKSFYFAGGFLFNSKEFEVKYGNWLVASTLFKSGKQSNKKEFLYNIISTNDKKIIYNIPDSKRLIDKTKKLKKQTEQVKRTLVYNSAIVKKEIVDTSTVPLDSIGCYVYIGNNLESSNYVYLLNTVPRYNTSDAQYLSVSKANIEKVAGNFAVRKAVRKNWLNSYDEYINPKITNKTEFTNFEKNSVIYSLFNNSSHQAAHRNVVVNNESFDIHNEWFWLSKEKVLNLAKHHNFDEMIEDIEKSGHERYMREYMYKNNRFFYNETRQVLDIVEDIFEKTFLLRKKQMNTHPEYNFNLWDIGWQQTRFLAKKYLKDEYNQFIRKYENLENRLVEQIYDFGYLKK